jgi:hypothetical protein
MFEEHPLFSMESVYRAYRRLPSAQAWDGECHAVRAEPGGEPFGFAQQISSFEAAFSGHVLLIRVGKFWQMLPGPIRVIAKA